MAIAAWSRSCKKSPEFQRQKPMSLQLTASNHHENRSRPLADEIRLVAAAQTLRVRPGRGTDNDLAKVGVMVRRFENHEVRSNLASILDLIRAQAHERIQMRQSPPEQTPTPSPFPLGKGNRIPPYPELSLQRAFIAPTSAGRGPRRPSETAQEIDQQLIYFPRSLLLDPMTRTGN